MPGASPIIRGKDAEVRQCPGRGQLEVRKWRYQELGAEEAGEFSEEAALEHDREARGRLLRTVSSQGKDHSQSLRALMDLTQRAIDDIGQALLSAAMAVHVQHLIDSKNINATEQRNLLNNNQATSAQTQSMANRVAKTTEQQTKRLNGVVKTSRKQLARITSVQQYLQSLIESVARYCKEILELVRRNDNGDDYRNAAAVRRLRGLGGEYAYIVEQLRAELTSLQGLHNLIVALFAGKPGWDKVLRRQYTITSARNNRILSSDSWSSQSPLEITYSCPWSSRNSATNVDVSDAAGY
ncbi:hypothetical protein BP5796_01221 [Coleophoma crateriformis]|uniref:Ubiquitin-like domain-containing protein n=1 Tax=Coleophoma crateriformis TaxID=565419 RepID=A0A3D8SZS6_9HELO|nr:hypothetical protein BP5796_01221 [Coleophoma crateriformis]